MRTQLSHFCDQFVSTVRPVFDPLGRALAALEPKPDGASAGTGEIADDDPSLALRSELVDLHHHLEQLCDKVAEQRAYVLIFGPLKSGKSTLMNSIAGAYVSEVSSLPAYPCLVFVSHGDKNEFVVSDYEGTTVTYTDTTKLRDRIDAAHSDLAEHIRRAEDDGELFDPQQHFPAAIRRVDVKVPAEKLRESGAVLVDTPGLYTRMRFGYDRMTRDFRNAAACAIFVVKSDTLFLEQVFTEFNQLLDLFSRIFLVINMDAAKRDVGPDGRLVPSMEQTSPERIVDAFEKLAMPAPLKEATKTGRLQIFPADLMNAASLTLQGKDVAATDFGKFRDSLEDYLASTDYLRAFLTDSFHRASHLLDQTREVTIGPFTEQLRADIHEADSRREALAEELRLLSDCQKLDWGPAFKRFAMELSDRLERSSRDVGARVARDMSAAIETWMLSSYSLRWLLDTVWKPLIDEYVQAVRDTAERCVEQSMYQDNAGLDFDADLVHFLRAIDVDFRPLRRAAFADLAAQSEAIPSIPLRVEDIPVRRGLLDVITFRSEARVRKRLFGADANNKLSARQKASRLGDAAKKFLNQFLLGFREDFFRKTIEETHERYSARLEEQTIGKLHDALKAREPELRTAIETLQNRTARLQGILAPVQEVHETSDEVAAAVETLSTTFAAADSHAILKPMPPRGSVSPAPKGEATASDATAGEPS